MVRMSVAAVLTAGLLAPTAAGAAQVRSSGPSGKSSQTLEERCRQEVDKQHSAGTLSKRRNERAILVQTCIDQARPK